MDFIFISFLLVALLANCNAAPSPASPTVDLGYTRLQGATYNNTAHAFLGVRYAAPPTGSLRLRPPAPPPRTDALVPAIKTAPICLGTDNDGYPGSRQSEDCLFANIYTPSLSPRKKLPVWVWIQGGGYCGNTNADYNGTELVTKHNVVFINFNYRVGVYGFLASKGLQEEGAMNLGLQDQRELLKWVRRHIGKFGGDKEHVVIHGASAGAGSTALHLLGPDEGLFHAVAGVSPYFPRIRPVAELQPQYQNVLNATGCKDVDCLRNLPVEQIQKANTRYPLPGRPSIPLYEFAPAVDGKLLKQQPYEAFAKNKFIKVPAIWGHDTNEGSYFATRSRGLVPADVDEFLLNQYPKLSNRSLAQIQKFYNPSTLPAVEGRPEYFPAASAAFGESTFTCPALYLQRKTRGWLYHCDVEDAGNTQNGFGVPHTWCVPGMLGLDNGGRGNDWEGPNRGVAGMIMGLFANFVENFNPVKKYGWMQFQKSDGKTAGIGGGDKEWTKDGRILFQRNGTRMEEISAGERERCEFWWRVWDELEQ